MKNISRKLVLSILTVVLTVVALGTTTFAWFTITNTANISAFEAQIVSDEGIEIAIGNINESLADGYQTKFEVNSPANLNWVTTLTKADVEEYIELMDATFRFDHLTSPDGNSFYAFESDAVGSSVTDGFLVLPIHFRSADVDTVRLTQLTMSGGSPLPTWISDVDSYVNASGVTVSRGGQITIDPSDSFRVAFQTELLTVNQTLVYEKPEGGSNRYLGGSGTTPIDLAAERTITVGETTYNYTQIGAHSYYSAKTAILPTGINAVEVAATTPTDAAAVDIITLLSGQTATAGMDFYNTMNIVIWVEGWDPNAYNSILDEFVSISFKFEAPSQP